MKQLVYPILDMDTCRHRGIEPQAVVFPWIELGLTAFQLRWKNAEEAAYLALARDLKKCWPSIFLIANDYARLVPGNFSMVHVGQEDWPREKQFLSAARIPFGISTHNPEQMTAALEMVPAPAYIALGPVRQTASKPTGKDPVLSPAALDLAVRLYCERSPAAGLVLIGGINSGNAEEILAPICRQYGIVPAVALIQGALDRKELTGILEVVNGQSGRSAGLERSLTLPGAT
jgi:thiamine-phosphate diphosphorylase